MKVSRAIVLLLALSISVMLSPSDCFARQGDHERDEVRQRGRGPGEARGRGPQADERREQEQQAGEESIWTEDEPRGPGGPRGPSRRGPRFELTDEEIKEILEGIKERDADKAKELESLRKEDPEEFMDQLRNEGREEMGKIFRRRAEEWFQRAQAEFLQWLEKNYREEAKELSRLKEKDAKLYWKKFDSVRDKYLRIYEQERRNPELATILKEDLALRETRDELLGKIRDTRSGRERGELIKQLEEVVAQRYKLIIRRQQIAYEQLLKRLEELNEQIKQSKETITNWQDEKVKEENVRNRTRELIRERVPRFRW